MKDEIRRNLDRVRSAVEKAAVAAGRDKNTVKLVAVTKSHPAEVILSAIAAGVTILGENKVQEADGKVAAVGRLKAEWHLIGRLQSNKARKAVQLFDVIHTVDSIELAERLERICIEEGREELKILVQADLAGEAAKSGIPERDLPDLIEFLNRCKYLRFLGLMLVPPFYDDVEKVRPFFRRLRELRDGLRQSGAFSAGSGELSMGMSHDFETAIEEGATIVRVGTAIFGERKYVTAESD
ncbi:MAG: YggS family pyridoxal phosphate-dependent enzyme [Pyrinomonadaceae bacterium]